MSLKSAIWAWLGVCAILMISLNSIGQEVRYGYTRYETRDGLNSQEVYCVFEDQKGFMWFGTDAGVSRFDGYEFTNFSAKDGLVNSTVFEIYEDPKGRIWFLGFGRSICYFENDSIYPYRYNHLLENSENHQGWVSDISVDTAETLYANYSVWGRIAVDRNGEICTPPPLINGGKEHLVSLPNGEKVIVGQLESEGKRGPIYYKWKGETLKMIEERNSREIFSLIAGNESFFLVIGDHLMQVEKDTTICFKPDRRVHSVALDSRGYTWISASNDGVKIYRETADFFNGEEPLISFLDGFNVSKILMSKNGSVWLSMENKGTCFIPDYRIENYTFEHEALTEVTALCNGPGSTFFYGIENGKVFQVNEEGKHQLIADQLNSITYLDYQEPDKLFISSYSNGKRTVVAEGLPFEVQLIIARSFCAVDSVVWQIFSEGLQKVENGKVVYQTDRDYFFKSVYQDADEIVWAGGNDGLFWFNGVQLERVDELPELKDVKVNHIQNYGENTLLIGTKDDGLLFLKREHGGYRLSKLGLTDYVKCSYVDDDQSIWLATNHGIVHVIPDENGVQLQRMNHINGLLSDNVNNIIGVGNVIYAGTNEGLVKFDKRYMPDNTKPPAIYLRGLHVNENEKKINQRIEVFAYDQNYFDFFYSALSFRNAGAVNYRYKLVGVDSVWQYTLSRHARYPSLSPGNYQFLVAAANENGVWSNNLEVGFIIQAPFWKKPWFVALAIFVLLIFLFLVFRVREQRKMARFEKIRQLNEQKRKVVEAKLVALRAQINPHFTFNALTAIQNVMVNFTMNEAINYMSSFSELMRRILENAQNLHIRVGDEIEMLKLYVELENLRFENTITCHFDIDQTIRLDTEEIPSMIIQPFVENAIIHGLAPKRSGEKQITIKMVNEPDQLICSVTDTGIGRKAAQLIRQNSRIKQQSLGIKITQERLQLFDTEKSNAFSFAITDRYDKGGAALGTTVTIRFKKKKWKKTD